MKTIFVVDSHTPASKYRNWANDRGLPLADMNSQLQRILYELENGEQWDAISKYEGMTFWEFSQSTETPYYLAGAFLDCYEKPTERNYDERGNQAEKWFDLLI